MDHRYSLRFETGERAGETIPVAGRNFTVGRRTGHSLQILDNSVSGQHAEIVVDDVGVILRDLGSTNGTRVGNERILETRLRGGDRVLFGNVQLVFLDATLPAAGNVAASAQSSARTPTGRPAPTRASEPASAAASTAATQAGPLATGATVVTAPDALRRVSADILARSRKASKVGLVGLAVLLAGAGGLWFFLRGSPPGGESAVRPAQAAPGNLLGEDFSFENGPGGWTAADGAPAAFLDGSLGRVSGAVAVSADLQAGAFALHRSREVRAAPGTNLAAQAVLRVDGSAQGCIGVELSAPEGEDAAGPVIAWSPLAKGTGDSVDASLSVLVPPGYETARVLVLGRAEQTGTVAVDDVGLSVGDAAGPAPLTVGDWQLSLLGEPPASALLSHFGRPLLTSLTFASGCAIPESADAGGMTPTAQTGGIVLVSAGRSSLCARVEPALARAGLATIGQAGGGQAAGAQAAGGTRASGSDGYATHDLEFDRDGVRSLLLGKGSELVRLAFATPVHVTGVAEGPAVRIRVRASPATGAAGLGELLVQLDFGEERKQAGDLAYKARNADKKGELGECLRLWSELLNAYPYEEQLVAEAEGKRVALVQQGLSELAAVRAEIERARFFQLADLFRQCRQKALATAARYRGSEVDDEAQKLAAGVESELAGLEVDSTNRERARVESILAALEAQKAAGLATVVREHLSALPTETGR